MNEPPDKLAGVYMEDAAVWKLLAQGHTSIKCRSQDTDSGPLNLKPVV